MINVVIHLRKEHDAKKLIQLLLTKKLIAAASIDFDNISYKMKEGCIVEETFNVITAQSKSLLFNEIVNILEKEIDQSIAINSTPIIGANGFFNESVRTKTIPI